MFGNIFLKKTKHHISKECRISTCSNRETVILPANRFMVIADLHMCFYEDMQKIKAAISNNLDAVFCLGDIFAEDIAEIAKSCKIYDIRCYYLLGNHDKWGQNANIENAYDLDGKTILINGISISGISGAPKYKNGNFAMRTENEIENIFKTLNKTDILLSHEAPYHLLSENQTHCGFQAITDFILKNQPKLHIFGHHHTREEKILGNTKEICIYQCAIIQINPFDIKYVL